MERGDMDNRSSLGDVRAFWEGAPLFSDESEFEVGTKAFFEQHRRTVVEDCYAGAMDERLYPPRADARTLDLGCGPMFWTTEFLSTGRAKDVVAADLTAAALRLGRTRLGIYGLNADAVQVNAEDLPFRDGSFDHVNCQGVIHHTPDTEVCVREIARVLRQGGTASVSVYYRNVILRQWRWLSWIGRALGRLGAGLKGRGREGIYQLEDVDEIVRLYDGAQNPIGKAYTERGFVKMLEPHFHVDEVFYHFFPVRSLPFAVPGAVHRWLDRKLPFMIYTRLTKRS